MSLQVWLPLNGDLHNQGLSSTTFSGTATYKSYGKLGGQSFNLQNRITCSTPALNGVQFFSIAFWGRIEANPDSTANWMDVIGFTDQKSDNSANGQFRFETGYGSDSQGGIHWHDNTTNAIIDGSSYYNTAAQRNEWHHIVVTVANDSIKSYYDGSLLRTHTTNLNKGHLTGAWWLGESTTRGCIQDVRIYDHTLSPKEVEEIAKGLVLHYKLDGETQIMVPSGYQQLEYLESSGENQYIDTGLVPTTNFQYNFKYSIITFNGYRGAFGAYSAEADNTTRIISINGSTANIYMYFNSKASSPNIRINNLTTATNQIIEGYFLKTEYWLKNLTTGSIFTQSSPTDLFPTKGNTLTATMKLFRYNINADNSGCNSRIYYFDTYNNGSCIQKLIPAKRLSDNVLGMYDIITSTFFTNAGTGTFTAGPNASITGTIYDSSGYSNNGTIVGTLTAAAPSPRYGTATQFNGTSSYIEAEPLPSETVTISTWVKFKTLPGSYKIILHDKSTGLAIGLTSTYRLITYVGNSNGGVGSQAQLPTLSTDTWYHIVVIKTGNTTRDVYFNGEQITNLSQNYWGGDLDKFTVGARHISGAYSNFFDGQISDIRVYTTALNSIQIKELYNTSMSIDSNGNVYARELVEL